MKVICVDDVRSIDGKHFDGLTKGKIYDVNFIDCDLVFITDDFGNRCGIHISRFEMINE